MNPDKQGPSRDERLDSWKSIAEYLGRSPRTVQRWHLEYRLPVRHVGGDSGPVFAYVHEIDHWLTSNSTVAGESGNGKLETVAPVLHTAQAAPSNEPLDLTGAIPEANRKRARDLVQLAARMKRVLSIDSMPAMAHLYREAINHDCTNASAFAGLSFVSTLHGLLGGLDPEIAYTAARAAILRAEDLAPDLPEAKSARAWLNIGIDRHRTDTRALLEFARVDRVLTSRVQVAEGLLALAENHLDDACRSFQAASFQSALNSVWAGLHTWSVYLTGDSDAAIHLAEQQRRAGRDGGLLSCVEALARSLGPRPSNLKLLIELTEKSPQNPVIRGALGSVYAQFGDEAKALAEIDILSSSHFGKASHYPIALIELALGRFDDAEHHLSDSSRNGSMWSLAFSLDPALMNSRQLGQPGHKATGGPQNLRATSSTALN